MSELLWPSLLAALVTGALGSGHCVAMCGGIAGALGLSSRAAAQTAGRSLWMPLAYNGGRVASYMLAGFIAGGVGSGVAAWSGLVHLRTALQLFGGVLMLLLGIGMAMGGGKWRWIENAGISIWRRLAPLLRPLLPIRTPPRAFAAGMVWGWLPCGMVYAMLLVAWLSASAVGGACVMLGFGLGTAPALVLAGAAARRYGELLLAPATRRIGGALVAVFGALALAMPWMPLHRIVEGCVTLVRW